MTRSVISMDGRLPYVTVYTQAGANHYMSVSMIRDAIRGEVDLEPEVVRRIIEEWLLGVMGGGWHD